MKLIPCQVWGSTVALHTIDENFLWFANSGNFLELHLQKSLVGFSSLRFDTLSYIQSYVSGLLGIELGAVVTPDKSMS